MMRKTWAQIAAALLLAGCAGVQPAVVAMHGGDPSAAGAPSAAVVPPSHFRVPGMSQESAPEAGEPHRHDHGASPGGEMNPEEPQIAESPEELVYACPMDRDVIASQPGDCPKCGMTLQPIAASEVYVCPMHSEVMSHDAGDCPKCGMTLVKQGAKE